MAEVKFVSIHDETAELKKEHLLDSGRFGMEGVVVQLMTNLKTTKPPGQVQARSIHSATKVPLVPSRKYMACELFGVLSLESTS